MDGPNAPTVHEVQTVYIFKKLQGQNLIKGTSFVNWYAIGECSSLEDLLRLEGPGTYVVQGRSGVIKGILCQAVQTVGKPEPITPTVLAPQRAELDVGKIVAAAVSGLAPILTVVTTFLTARAQERERDRQLAREQATADRERQDRIVSEQMERESQRQQEFAKLMTSLMTARTADLESMIRGMQTGGGGTGAGGGDRAYREGQADVLAMLDAAKESGVLGGDSETKIIDFLSALVGGGKQASGELTPEMIEAAKKLLKPEVPSS